MKTQAAAIEFGTSKIVTILAESGGFNRCEIIGSGTVHYDGYKGGYWNRPDLLADAVRNSISAAELEAKTRIRSVYVGVPCEYFKVRVAEAEIDIDSADGRIWDEHVDAVMDAAADKLRLVEMEATVIHRSPAWFSADDKKHTLNIVGTSAAKLKAMVSFIVVDPDFMEDVCELFSALGITVMGFFAPVLGQVLLTLPQEDRERSAILVDVGYLNTEITVAEGEACVYHAVLPIGGGNIAADLVYDLQLSLREAEEIKRTFQLIEDGFDKPLPVVTLMDEFGGRLELPREAVKSSIEHSLDELCDMIGKTIRDAADMTGPRSQIYLTGGGIAMMKGGREYLSQKLERPVRMPAPRTNRLSNPNYTSVLGMLDLVFDALEERTPQDESLPGKLVNSVKNMFGRK